jgi:hypothetical protein
MKQPNRVKLGATFVQFNPAEPQAVQRNTITGFIFVAEIGASGAGAESPFQLAHGHTSNSLRWEYGGQTLRIEIPFQSVQRDAPDSSSGSKRCSEGTLPLGGLRGNVNL